MKYFTMSECINSENAKRNHIENNPIEEHKKHIEETINILIDPLRDAWEWYCLGANLGSPGIRISSGYRSTQLNVAVGGSSTSAHSHGYAFDLIPVNGEMVAFKSFCRKFLAHHPFDQLISEGEDDNGVPGWMHVGYKHPNGKQRCQFLSMKDGKYSPMTN